MLRVVFVDIFFTSSTSGKAKWQRYYDHILNEIEKHGCHIYSLERQQYSDLLDLKNARKIQNKVSIHNQYIKKAISLSDAVIIEASSYSFKLGQELQFALNKKIPVLLFSNKLNFAEKIQDPCLYSVLYKSYEDIDKSISKFFANVRKKHLNKRMGIFLHNRQINFLDWYVEKKDIDSNRSKVIRMALNNFMEGFTDYKKS